MFDLHKKQVTLKSCSFKKVDVNLDHFFFVNKYMLLRHINGNYFIFEIIDVF